MQIAYSAALPAARYQALSVTAGKTYNLKCVYSVVSGTAVKFFLTVKDTTSVTSAALAETLVTASSGASGSISLYYTAASTRTVYVMGLIYDVAGTINFDNISVRELAGQHATQSITAALAAYRSGPARVDYDAVDDFHRVVFPAMSNATIAYSSPSVGATILTGQTIAAGNFDWNTDDCGLIIIDRPLTTAETIEVTAYLNAKAV